MISVTIAMIIELIATNRHLAYSIVFLLALSEAVPVFGAVVPGSVLIVAISALAPQGLVSLWPLLTAALLGAVAGDGIAYWLGHRYQGTILQRWPLSRHPKLVERSEAFFLRHGAKSVFLARFVPGLRAFVPLVAGMLRTPPARFYAANILSALIWAPAHILPGVAIGASLSVAGPLAGRVAVLLVIFVLLAWLLVVAARHAARRGIPVLLTFCDKLRQWAEGHRTLVGRGVAALLDPARTDVRARAIVGALALGGAWIFLALLEDVATGDPLIYLDQTIYNTFQGLRTPDLDAVMIVVSAFGDAVVVASVAIAIGSWLLLQRAWRTLFYWAAAVGLASVMNTSIKVLVHRARPMGDLYTGWSAFSFPSNHTTVNAVMYGLLALILARGLRPGSRLPAVVMTFVWICVMALSRIYLGAHWFSDVAAGLAFAAVWVAGFGLAYVRFNPKPITALPLATVAVSALLVIGITNSWLRWNQDVERYAAPAPAPAMTVADWLGDGWRQLPASRTALAGDAEEAMIIQWAGDPQEIEATLSARGWLRPTPWTVRSALAWLSPNATFSILPVIPSAQAGRLPMLTLVRAVPETGGHAQEVLRLWTADILLSGNCVMPLHIGSVVLEKLSHPLSLFTVAWTNTAGSKFPPELAEFGSHVSRGEGSQLVLVEGVCPAARRDTPSFLPPRQPRRAFA